MKRLLPWSLILTVVLALIPIASQFTPHEVGTKLATWNTIAQVVVAILLAAVLVRMAMLYFGSKHRPATNVSAHDVRLFSRINEVIDDGALTFLGQHDFHLDAYRGQLDPITTITYWHGPNYAFNDDVIEERWQTLLGKIHHLQDVYGDNLTNSEHDVDRMTAWHVGIPRNAQPPQVEDEIKALNDASAEVYKEFNTFAPFVRKRLGL